MRGGRNSKLRVGVGLCALLAGGVLLLPGGAAASRQASAAAGPVPHGFVGMNASGPLFGPGVDAGGQLKKMAASGVQRLRVLFTWGKAQPYATCSSVPGGCNGHPYVAGPGGVPTNFTATDRVVKLAAKRHLALLPVVEYSPFWDASPHGSHIRPARDAPYGQYLTALVQRYGPHGKFWSAHRSLPRDPITEWQIWNEPDLSYLWGPRKFAPSYVALLRVAHKAIKRADPRAKVVLASLTNYGWNDLDSIYKVRGSRGLFDAVSADVYTAHPAGVITILRYYRQVMARHGDRRKDIIAGEVGWPSDRGRSTQNPPFSTTKKGQATKLSRLLPLLARDRHELRLAGFFYFTWVATDRGGPQSWPNYSGLFHFDSATHRISAKPAYRAFVRTVHNLEH